ncbi:SH3 domain-containing protein [Hirschia baltica]|uniref:SH3 domain-containing protein n=1 Tax=Hirschia baltica TaxID=2724 RepID=UPI00059C2A73|nr:SH3 domain-containing protein [Hirschia baltica]
MDKTVIKEGTNKLNLIDELNSFGNVSGNISVYDQNMIVKECALDNQILIGLEAVSVLNSNNLKKVENFYCYIYPTKGNGGWMHAKFLHYYEAPWESFCLASNKDELDPIDVKILCSENRIANLSLDEIAAVKDPTFTHDYLTMMSRGGSVTKLHNSSVVRFKMQWMEDVLYLNKEHPDWAFPDVKEKMFKHGYSSLQPSTWELVKQLKDLNFTANESDLRLKQLTKIMKFCYSRLESLPEEYQPYKPHEKCFSAVVQRKVNSSDLNNNSQITGKCCTSVGKVRAGDMLNVRSAPDSTARILFQLEPDHKHLRIFRCTGDTALNEVLTSLENETIIQKTWCEISDLDLVKRGWVNAYFLYGWESSNK